MAEVARVFRYRAVEPGSGRVHTGEISGDSAYAVRSALRRSGWQVESVQKVEPWRWPLAESVVLRTWRRWWVARRCRNRRAQRADLFDAIGALIAAGIPLEQALARLASSSARAAPERRMLRAVRDRVRAGEPLSAACAAHADWFDAVDLAVLDAGQAAGELPSMLSGLASFHQSGSSSGHRLTMALAYPALLMMAALGVTVFISRNTLPQLLAMVRDAGLDEPLLSRLVVTVGQGLVLWWPVVLLATVLLTWGLRAWATRLDPQSRFGARVHGNALARARGRLRVAQLATVLSRLLQSGIPLDEALEVVAQSAGQRALRDLLQRSAEAVRRGEDFSALLEASPLLDPEFAQLLRVAEQAGDLPEVLARIAERSERAAARSIDRVALILEPLAILFLAGLIGTIVMAAVLPLVRLGDML